MQTKDLVSTLRKFDAYPKTLEDFRVKTFGGAAGKWIKLVSEVLNDTKWIVSTVL